MTYPVVDFDQRAGADFIADDRSAPGCIALRTVSMLRPSVRQADYPLGVAAAEGGTAPRQGRGYLEEELQHGA
jgi:hypothetical protein